MVDDPVDVQPDGGIEVILPSNATFRVLTTSEAQYVTERVERYQADNKFVNISDLQDVDKMILYEMFLWRWSMWQSMNEDYWGNDIQPKTLADQISNLSGELRQLKRMLGIDKVARDRVRGDDSIPVYLDQLAFRAEQFGIMRDEQHAQVITSFQRISGLLTYHDKCTDDERLEFHCTAADLIEVLRAEITKFEAIDEKFRHTQQKMWIRRQ